MKALRELRRHGLVVLPGAIPPWLCDQARHEYANFVAASTEAPKWVDAHGLHSRLSNFHLTSGALTAIAVTKKVLEVCDAFFEARAAIYSSLTFERGTQQALHRDVPYFHTEPAGRFLGVWVALEDIGEDAGPLFYVRDGHRQQIPPPTGDVGVERLVEQYQAQLRGTPRTVTANKGDVVIWHPFLPHGGASIEKPGATRFSVVFHCVPEGTTISGPSTWLGLAPPSAQHTWIERDGRLFADADVQFFADI